MSAKATTWAWEQNISLASAKLVLLCLADSHDAYSGRVDSDVSHITKTTGLSVKTVRASLGRLEKAGLVSTTEHTVSPPGYALGLDGGGE